MQFNEQDAHDALFEFERRFKAGNYNQQVATIQSFPTLLTDLLPHPTLQGLSFLRLTDLFIQCANHGLRRRILLLLRHPLCQQTIAKAHCQGHHVEEIVRRLGNLWESNDGMARIEVIEFYGRLAGMVARCAEVVYRLRECLTKDEEEVDAAVEAIKKLAIVDGRLVVSGTADVLLSFLESSHPASHRYSSILEILSIPSYDALTDMLILQHLEQKKWTNNNNTDDDDDNGDDSDNENDETTIQSLKSKIKQRLGLYYLLY